MNEGTFFSRLAQVQAQIKPATMDGTNPHFKSRYATLASLHAACMPALTAAGFSVRQSVTESDGFLYCETIVQADDGQISCTCPVGKPRDTSPQAYGSAITYARRYSLATCLGLVSDDDDDANEAQPIQDRPAASNRPAPKPAAPARDPLDADIERAFTDMMVPIPQRRPMFKKLSALYGTKEQTASRLIDMASAGTTYEALVEMIGGAT